MSNLKKDGMQRWAPSFLRRQGQMTPRQKRAYRDHWEERGLEFRFGEVLDLDRAFAVPGPFVLEIGFGMGDHLLELAAANPETGFVGIEVHKPGIGAALARIAEEGLENVRLIRGDARLVLEDHLRGRPFEVVHLLFPDPWPKPGDAHRRIVQDDLVDLLEARLQEGGRFHTATDVDSYAAHIRDTMKHRTGWQSCPTVGDRLTTRYEQKGLESGRSVHEQSFRFLP